MQILRYFKAHIGRWNCSWHHENQPRDLWGWDNISVKIPHIPASVSTYYITYISYTTNRSMEIWINTSSNASFTTTQGTEVFAYDRYDFLANINAGWRRGTIVINGQKEITIKNQLFALFDTDYLFSPGFEALKYQSPTGENDWIYLIDHLYTNYSDSFYETLWWGTNGTWSFKVNMMKMELVRHTPNVYLMGADIRLPE